MRQQERYPAVNPRDLSHVGQHGTKISNYFYIFCLPFLLTLIYFVMAIRMISRFAKMFVIPKM